MAKRARGVAEVTWTALIVLGALILYLTYVWALWGVEYAYRAGRHAATTVRVPRRTGLGSEPS